MYLFVCDKELGNFQPVAKTRVRNVKKLITILTQELDSNFDKDLRVSRMFVGNKVWKTSSILVANKKVIYRYDVINKKVQERETHRAYVDDMIKTRNRPIFIPGE